MAQRRKQKTNGTTSPMKNGTININNNTIAATAVVPNNNGNGIAVSPVSYITRQDSRLSVKSLIESIENTSKQTRVSSSGSQSGSQTSLNNLSVTETQQQQCEKISAAIDQEKQQKNLNNNSITNNHNSSILTTSNNVNVNGTQKSGGKINDYGIYGRLE
jgi:hypothetical protein